MDQFTGSTFLDQCLFTILPANERKILRWVLLSMNCLCLSSEYGKDGWRDASWVGNQGGKGVVDEVSQVSQVVKVGINEQTRKSVQVSSLQADSIS